MGIERWIVENLPANYAWPGNVRELEQCVRNIIVRKQYRPRSAGRAAAKASPRQELTAAFLEGALTADELLSRYCTLIYFQTGSYEQAAKKLKLDRRTVKSKVDPVLLARL